MMIINSFRAADMLLQTLDNIKPRATAWRALHVHVPSVGGNMVGLQEPLYQIQENISQNRKAQAFFCDTGDIFILLRGARMDELEDLKDVILDAFAGEIEARDAYVHILDLSVKWSFLKGLAEKVSEEERKAFEKENMTAEKCIARVIDQVDMDYAKGLLSQREHRKGVHILVAEDDEFTQQIVGNILRDFTVIKATNGPEVLSSYLLNAPDMVFLDINLPLIDGHKLLNEIMDFDPEAFVVMLSGNSQIKNVMKSMDAGAKGFVTKPFPREKLENYAKMCATFKESHMRVVGG